MAKPATIDAYIEAAPAAGRAHLRRLRELLAEAAPKAEQVIKWGQPFFIEPRFLFAFSAHKAHLAFAPMESGLDPFRDQFGKYASTKNYLKVRYDEALPEALIRRIAKRRVQEVRKRKDDAFW